MHKFTKTLVAVTLLASANVKALGIGGIKLHSALNQRLNAEIPLTLANGEAAEAIHVKMASPAKFDAAGIAWSHFLNKIRFAPLTRGDGSIIIKLTSDEVLKEPFLNFLLEVSSAKGSSFREFTVLLDPPNTKNKTLERKAARVIVDAPVPASASSKNTSNSHAQGHFYPEVGEYGPVHPNDTVWSIANQVKPDNVTTTQMALAIYAANPGAFYRPNLHALVTGETLIIPSRDEILRLTKHQPITPSKHTPRKLNNPVRKIAPSVERKIKPTINPSANVSGNALKINAPLTSAASVSRELNPEPSAELNVPEITPPPNSSDNSTPVKTVIPDSELKARFAQMEQQLQTMQKLLEAKGIPAPNLPTKALTSAIPESTPPAARTTGNPVQAIEVLPEILPQTTPSIQPNANVPSSVPIASTLNPNAPLNTVQPKPIARPVEETEETLGNYWLFGGVGLCVLGALGLVWWRKRRAEKTVDTESMFSSATQISLPDIDKEISTAQEIPSSGYEVGLVGESAFLSEFTPTDFDAFETEQTEIDPLSEADVYLAYGRYQQAEELIRQVLKERPERDECRLKLLEIFQASDNKPGFTQYVNQLRTDGKAVDTAFWAKVVEMIEEFIPEASVLKGQPNNISTASEANSPPGSPGAVPSSTAPVTLDAFDIDLAPLTFPAQTDAPISNFGTSGVKLSKEAPVTQTLSTPFMSPDAVDHELAQDPFSTADKAFPEHDLTHSEFDDLELLHAKPSLSQTLNTELKAQALVQPDALTLASEVLKEPEWQAPSKIDTLNLELPLVPDEADSLTDSALSLEFTLPTTDTDDDLALSLTLDEHDAPVDFGDFTLEYPGTTDTINPFPNKASQADNTSSVLLSDSATLTTEPLMLDFSWNDADLQTDAPEDNVPSPHNPMLAEDELSLHDFNLELDFDLSDDRAGIKKNTNALTYDAIESVADFNLLCGEATPDTRPTATTQASLPKTDNDTIKIN